MWFFKMWGEKLLLFLTRLNHNPHGNCLGPPIHVIVRKKFYLLKKKKSFIFVAAVKFIFRLQINIYFEKVWLTKVDVFRLKF